MSHSTQLITANQRVIDQLALENLNGLKAMQESAIQEKIKSDKKLVLRYLRSKLLYVSSIDSSMINLMAEDEFVRVLKIAKIMHFSGMLILNEIAVCFVKFFKGYRKCSKCNEVFHKNMLQCIDVMVGFMDSESRYFCNSCADAYLSRISRGHGPFSHMARAVSGRFPDNTL